jgi:hypothetical protein
MVFLDKVLGNRPREGLFPWLSINAAPHLLSIRSTRHTREVDRALEVKEPLQNPRIAPRVIPVIITFLMAAVIIVVLLVLPR